MPRYRLDERLHLSPRISRRRKIWLEEIQFEEDGEIYYTENYVQISLVKLLKYLKHYPLIKPMEELILACNELNQALTEKIAAETLLLEAKQRVERARSKFNAAQVLPEIKALEHQTPVIYSFEGNFYCIYIADNRFFADKAKVIS